MIDTGFAAVIGAVLAFAAVGVAALIHRSTALGAQRAAEQAKGLVRAIHLVELHGQSRQNSIFNETMARPPESGGGFALDADYDQYGPRRREVRATSPEELSEIAALLAAYGSASMDAAYETWTTALAGIEEAHRVSEYAYFEQRERPRAETFAASVEREQKARTELGKLVRATLAGSRARRTR